MQLVDETNLQFYETRLEESSHTMPNVNTVRCERWFFRRNREPGKLLDYGFGWGQELLYFAEQGYDVYGLDIVDSAKEQVDRFVRENRPHLADKIKTDILDANATSLPYADASFDFIHSNQTIYHLPSEQAIKTLLDEWNRVLKPGGLLIFSTMGPQNTIIQTGHLVGENLYESEYDSADKIDGASAPKKMRIFLMKDEAHIRSICDMFKIHEVGWFSNHYCGIDGFHWEVLASKS